MTAMQKLSEYGRVSLSTTSATQGLSSAVTSAPLYTPSVSVKPPEDVKTPQLPFGENVAVATGAAGP